MDDVLPRFLAESWRILAEIDTRAFALETEEHSSQLAAFLRGIRTIKINCGFLGLTALGSLAHALEKVLDPIRSGQLQASAQSSALISAAIEALKVLLRRIEHGDQESPPGNYDLIRRLSALASGENIGPVHEERRRVAHLIPVSANGVATISSSKSAVLVFESAGAQRMAIPLSFVARLEKLPRRAIERTAAGLVVPFRSGLLFLLPVEGAESARLNDPQPVIILADETNSTGLLIERVEDIVYEQLVIHGRSRRPGFSGTAIINGRATDIVDARHYLNRQIVERGDINVGANA